MNWSYRLVMSILCINISKKQKLSINVKIKYELLIMKNRYILNIIIWNHYLFPLALLSSLCAMPSLITHASTSYLYVTPTKILASSFLLEPYKQKKSKYDPSLVVYLQFISTLKTRGWFWINIHHLVFQQIKKYIWTTWILGTIIILGPFKLISTTRNGTKH